MPSTRTYLTAAALTATAGLAAAAPAMAAPSVRDVDAELLPGNRLHLQAETSAGARTVRFTIAGRTIKGRLSEIDRDDRSREWERIVRARGIGVGQRRIAVRACGRGGCATRSFTVFVERDD